MGGGSARGVALVDVLPALSIAALLSAIALPVIAGTLERERTTLAAHFLAARVTETQLEALRRGTAVALAFDLTGEDAGFQMFADGNGNGVLRRDIDEGIDVPVGPVEHLDIRAPGVTLRINQRVLDPGGAGWLNAGADPLRIGSTSLVSCAPTGSLTGGTLYVAAAGGPQLAVRITGSTGRVRVLRFEPSLDAWTF